MLNQLLKREMAALDAAKLQLSISRYELSLAKNDVIETTEACLVKPATLAGLFAGGVASDLLADSSTKSSGFLSTLKLSFITQILGALADADEVAATPANDS
ncbi:hypothetical protein QWY82_19830 [Simiduia curdlanivorans]|uniref:Uncharacterized protein n=1 Tax=Simiduia curdlanivorans TaxID=1492769 RepID=A0ABV8V2K4_9GAMM|nr:hypothetical protein [Simiduia curdlanivorans]MDN3641060.1 hypothetical protein [Simiduia curdlanivorans]